MSWKSIVSPLLAPFGKWLAKKLFTKRGKAVPREPEDPEAARKGAAVGEAYRKASREAGPKGRRDGK